MSFSIFFHYLVVVVVVVVVVLGISLCSPSQPRAHYVDQAGLEPTESSYCASPVLSLKVCVCRAGEMAQQLRVLVAQLRVLVPGLPSKFDSNLHCLKKLFARLLLLDKIKQ